MLDILSAILLLSGLGVFLYGTTFVANGDFSFKCVIGFLILIAGLTGIQLLGGFAVDSFLNFGEVAASGGGVMVSLAAISVVNAYGSRVSLSVTPISAGLYLMLIGIAEEVFFRGFLLTLFSRSGNEAVAVLVSSAIGAVYHSAVYGASTSLLLIVFGCFSVLGFVYVSSGYRLSVTMVAHAAVNLLGVLG